MSIDSTAELAHVNSSATLHFILNGFLARYPQRTRTVYAGHLRQWFGFCAAHNVDVLAAQRAHIEAWARHLDEVRHLKPATVAAKLNAVCGLYKYACLDGHLQVNPASHVRRPKIQFVSRTQALSRPQLADILNAAERRGPNVFAFMCLLALSGLRISETLAVDCRAGAQSVRSPTARRPRRSHQPRELLRLETSPDLSRMCRIASPAVAMSTTVPPGGAA